MCRRRERAATDRHRDVDETWKGPCQGEQRVGHLRLERRPSQRRQAPPDSPVPHLARPLRTLTAALVDGRAAASGRSAGLVLAVFLQPNCECEGTSPPHCELADTHAAPTVTSRSGRHSRRRTIPTTPRAGPVVSAGSVLFPALDPPDRALPRSRTRPSSAFRSMGWENGTASEIRVTTSRSFTSSTTGGPATERGRGEV